MEYVNIIWKYITGLTGEQVALISIAITLVLHLINQHHELKLKKYETKRTEYDKFIKFTTTFFTKFDDISQKNPEVLRELEKEFYEYGAAFSIYASKRLYREYLFFRRITIDKNIQSLQYFDNHLIIYSLAKMLKIIRKEIGLNTDLISVPETLSFAVNDITKPELLLQYYENRYRRTMIKAIILGSKIKSTHWIKGIYYCFIKPLFSIPFLIFSLLLLNLILKPLKKIYEFLSFEN
jgi:hypothetical protein